jgi:hypothetical protein
MPFGALLLFGVVFAALCMRSRSTHTTGAGPVGPLVNVNPIMGDRRATVRFGQHVRVNLPNDWRVIQSMSDNQAAPPLLQTQGSEDGGFHFRTASVGRQQLTFSGDGRTIALDFDVIVDAPQASAAGLRWPSRH